MRSIREWRKVSRRYQEPCPKAPDREETEPLQRKAMRIGRQETTDRHQDQKKIQETVHRAGCCPFHGPPLLPVEPHRSIGPRHAAA